MWEDPMRLWLRLALGREEYLQRLLTTLIADGTPPKWNSPIVPGARGRQFLHALDVLAYGDAEPLPDDAVFVDELMLPKLEGEMANGWPDWAVLSAGRAWIIELKTETGSHRHGQLPYYLQLADAAHDGKSIDLTYVTGPLVRMAPPTLYGQRYAHLLWDDVLPLVLDAWGEDERPGVRAYVDMVRTLAQNLTKLRPAEQRAAVIGEAGRAESSAAEEQHAEKPSDLLALARATAEDGQQRAMGATTPEDLEAMRQEARRVIRELPTGDPVRHVLPWLWQSGQTDGRAMTIEGAEHGYELRFSRYSTIQIWD